MIHNKLLELRRQYNYFAAVTDAANRMANQHGQCWSCGNFLFHKAGCAVFSGDSARYLNPSFAQLKIINSLNA